MLVAVPSKGRAGNTPSIDLLGKYATLFVPASEAGDYERLATRGEKVVSVPNSVKGITCTRNWILDRAKKAKDKWVVFVDDDLLDQGYHELNSFRVKHRRLTGSEWLNEWAKLFDLTEQMGYRIWGVSTDGAPRSVYPWSPFMWQSYITASCMGILTGSGVRFDESYPVKEDYEICLRCIKEDGGVVAARYLYWQNAHWEGDGGCKDYRTASMEREMIDKLVADYPGLIRKVERKNGASDYSIQLDF